METKTETVEDQGFFEEFILDMVYNEKPTCLGTRRCGNPDGRELGFYGRREFAITEPITLDKGHRQVTYKASKEKPIFVRTMLQRFEGELK